ncbi:3-hydroxyacyl-ACP dehydratase FabZ [Kangiella koreensis]|uniref:3-hydroxyacyl-[acyl-carrier-protein] dehydratase FabZ n=1 Tax=Kangiella koreensis (strain DSM 16069 / JCM 12317 / KCTC 12182 / SW-125) TaxID=523791 RepID=C7R5Y7_KANKD|nr:beta-hydroxyacyl-(acyl-carrier-protein) dehydratase FabZ [Kangiella koreensis DSM 16069]
MSDNDVTEMNSMDIYEVMKHLPHRYPFLLVDRVVDFKAGEYLKAIKNVTVNEPFFPGHFPHRPVFPGVLMLEAMAQASGILAFKTTESLPTDDSLFYFVGIDDARFKKPVEPGDQVVMEVTVLKRKRDMWKFSAVATVDGKVVCSAELMCAKKDIA